MAYRSLEEALARGRGRERPFRCPVHGDSHASASVNVVKGLWYCYVCGAKGTTTDIIETPDFEFSRQMLEEVDAAEARVYPESWLDLFHRPGVHHPYWLGRFAPETIDHFRLGFNALRSVQGQPRPSPCYPLRDPAGLVLGLVYRQLEHQPKYVYPPGSAVSEKLYGYTDAQRDHVLLVEGAVDAMACWEAGHEAWALFGATISKTQIRLLHRAGVTRVGLVMDNDAAGVRAVTGYRKDSGDYVPGLEWKLSTAGFEVVVADWTGRPEKDVAEIPRQLRTSFLDPLAP